MTKARAGIIYRPDLSDLDEVLLYEYLSNRKGSMSAAIVDTISNWHLPIAMLSDGSYDQAQMKMVAVKSIVNLKSQIEMIYMLYSAAGIELPAHGTTAHRDELMAPQVTKAHPSEAKTKESVLPLAKSDKSVEIDDDDDDDDDDDWRTPIITSNMKINLED